MMTSSVNPGKQPRVINRIDGEDLVRILDTVRAFLLAIIVLFFLLGSTIRPSLRQDGAYAGIRDSLDNASGHLFGVGYDDRAEAAGDQLPCQVKIRHLQPSRGRTCRLPSCPFAWRRQ